MVVVFVDPHCKHFRIFKIESPTQANGYYVHFDGSIQDFVAEITLTGLAKLTARWEFSVSHPDRILDPIMVVDAIQKVATRCSSTHVIEGFEQDVLLSKLLGLAEQYRRCLDTCVDAMEKSSFHEQLQGVLGDIHSLDQQYLWKSSFPRPNGVLHVMIDGIGSGKSIQWPEAIESCRDNQCTLGKVRRKVIAANVVYSQMQWIVKQLSYGAIGGNEPTTVEFDLDGHIHDEHRYNNTWYPVETDHNVFRLDIMRLPKRLTLWAEFEPHAKVV